MSDVDFGSDAIEWLGVKYKTLLKASDSNGAISVTDSLSPLHSGPPRHIHHDADETFVVLTGTVGFWLDGETTVRGPGESQFIPRGKPHTFIILEGDLSRHLVILTPGGFEGFFEDMAAGQYAIPDDMAQIEQSAQKFNLTFCGPPLTPADFGR